MASELLRAGADPDLVNSRGESALHHAVASGYGDRVTLLVSNGGNVNVVTSDGVSALMIASANDFREITVALVEAGLT